MSRKHGLAFFILALFLLKIGVIDYARNYQPLRDRKLASDKMYARGIQ